MVSSIVSSFLVHTEVIGDGLPHVIDDNGNLHREAGHHDGEPKDAGHRIRRRNVCQSLNDLRHCHTSSIVAPLHAQWPVVAPLYLPRLASTSHRKPMNLANVTDNVLAPMARNLLRSRKMLQHCAVLVP